MNVTTRRMAPEDCDEVIALWQASEGVGLDDVDTRGCIEAHLRRNAGMSFVAEGGGRIVAAALCGTDGRRGYLHHLAVAASHRGQGLGRSLAQRCIQALAAAGIRKCHIFVFARNIAARNFWRAIGWHRREDLVVMSKDL
jgi:ribosomal protein S18 acetylase RimI-like enzyme